MHRQLIAAAVPLALAACAQERDAASEEPVGVRAGLYEVSTDNIGIWGLTSKQAAQRAPKEICLSETDIGTWPRTFVRAGVAPDADCAVAAPRRTGNAFEGTVICPIDESDASGEIQMIYSGTLDRERSEVRARMKVDITPRSTSNEERLKIAAATQLLKNVELTVTAERKGDCP